MFQHFQIDEMDEYLLEFADRLSLELKGDNLRALFAEWGNTLLGMKEN